MHPTYRAAALLAGLTVVTAAAACGSAKTRDFPVDPGSTSDGPDAAPPSFAEAGAACTGLRCAVPTRCAPGTTTAVEGDLYDPAGKVKLYGGIAYVPNAELDALATGATCDRCGTVSGDPIATALTDANGHFRIEGVPAGKDVPLVVQIGKWRRRMVVKNVEACTTTRIPDGDAHLPRNQTEGELPQVAVVTGGFDELGCLLSRIGVDGTEYTTPDSFGRIHVYRGVGGGNTMTATAPAASELWGDAAKLAKYDMVLLACEGWEYDEDDGTNGNKTVAAKQIMHDYAANGGRIFATHYHYTWFEQSPQADFRSVATWNPPSSAYGHKTLKVDTSFPKGAAFAKWLVQAGATNTAGTVDVDNPGSNVASVNAATAQRWLYTDDPANVAFMSFNVPVGAPPAEQCGRAVFSDVHVSGEQGGRNIPGNCGAAKLTPQELALEFLLFDLASCVLPDSQTPTAPPVK
jgi:hypothetical protein